MYLGVDVGGTKTLVARFSESGRIEAQERFETPSSQSAFLKLLTKTAKKLATPQLRAAGVGVPGSIDHGKGVMIAGGRVRWHNLPIGESLGTALSVPVAVENDAMLGGLAEARMGAGQGFESVLYVTISTGVGTGIILNGQIPPTVSGSEGGHMLYQVDDELVKFEDLVSGPALVERFGAPGYEITDPAVWDTFAQDLALGLFNMITLFMPRVVVLGGGVSVHFDKFGAHLLRHIEAYDHGIFALPEIRQATHVETAVLHGSYLLAKDALKTE